MNWWLNLYFGEGPGIPKDTPRPTGWRLITSTIAREWWNLIVLNILFIAASLPLITIPAAYTAMLRVTILMVEDEPCEPWRDFRETFVQVFFRSLGMGLLIVALIGASLVSLRSYGQAASENLLYTGPFAIALAVETLALVFAVFLFHLLATSQRAPLAKICEAAAVAMLVRPIPVLLALCANLALWGVHVLAYPSSILLAVLVNFSFGSLFLSFAAHKTAQDCLGYVSNRHAQRPNNNNTPT